MTWTYTILICLVAFFAKVVGCAGMSKLTGSTYREAGAIGILLSCKGYVLDSMRRLNELTSLSRLIEIVVLNVGLQSGILSDKLFSMFVVHALVLTLLTTPLTLWVFPVQSHVAPAVHRKSNSERNQPASLTRFLLVVSFVDDLPSSLTWLKILLPSHRKETREGSLVSTSEDKQVVNASPLVEAVRLMELADRTSSTMSATSAHDWIHRDPVTAVLRTFTTLHGMALHATLSVVPFEDFVPTLFRRASETEAHLMVIPWSLRGTTPTLPLRNPFDHMFEKGHSGPHPHFIRKAMADASLPLAVIVDRGLAMATCKTYHLFCPFLGGADDRLALAFVQQLCLAGGVTATLLRIRPTNVLSTPSPRVEHTPGAVCLQGLEHLHNILTCSLSGRFPRTWTPSIQPWTGIRVCNRPRRMS